MNIPESCLTLRGKLIVSCQADEGDAFYGAMDRYAKAALAGGAAGIRANGPADIRAIRRIVDLPIIGIQKALHSDNKILITPTFEAAKLLVENGADMVALDCTKRGQNSGAFERLRRIQTELRVPVLADIATVEEAIDSVNAGADVVLSTMRGYTDDTSHVVRFDPRFIEALVHAVNVPVIAEGRVDTPDLARQAIQAGAFSVVVGTVISRPHSVVRAFSTQVEAAFAAREQEQWILGIDLGGTNTKLGLVSNRGQLLWDETSPTPARSGRAGLLKHLEAAALRGLNRARESGRQATAIGIGTAGWVDPSTGSVVYATENLPGWTGARVAETIGEATGTKVFVENDANALAVGEKFFGVARDFSDFVCITLGTGVGGGCFIGGRLNHGAHCFANAFGHMCIEPGGRDCSCGKKGCLEAYTNAQALLEYGGKRYESVQRLIAAANAADEIATHAVDLFAARLAQGCSLLVQLLDPDALIFSGGVAHGNSRLIPALERHLAILVPVWEQRNLKLLNSSIGYHAGVLGAAALALTV
jgi:N-acetylmannosamine-6-phosphate 2-epimerase / N-acetylmannosamine kinase